MTGRTARQGARLPRTPPAVEKPTWTAASSPGELRPAGPVSTPEQGRGRRAARVRSPARRAPPALVAAPCRVVRPLNPSAWEQKVVSPVLPVIPGSPGPSPRLGRLRYLRRRLPVPAARAGSREQAERWQLEEWGRSCPIRMRSSWARWSSTSRRLRGRPGRRGPWGVRASPSCRWWEPAGVARRREPSSAGRVQQQPRLRSPTDEANPSYTKSRYGSIRRRIQKERYPSIRASDTEKNRKRLLHSTKEKHTLASRAEDLREEAGNDRIARPRGGRSRPAHRDVPSARAKHGEPIRRPR